MDFVYDDGGRQAAGYKGLTGDCVIRAIAIATKQDYKKVYKDIKTIMGKGETPRNGVPKKVYTKYLQTLGWIWNPTMKIGSGCKVHLDEKELPKGRLIVRLSKHLSCVVDGVIHDTYNPVREINTVESDTGRALKLGEWRNTNGICSVQKRCVYGYWISESNGQG